MKTSFTKAKRFAKVFTAAMMAVLMLVAVCSCGSKDAWPVDKETGLTELYIGGIGPTSGDNANYGTSVRNGAKLAVDEINSAGGVNGFKFVLHFQDSQGDPESAVSAFGKQMDEGMKVSLGGTFSGETKSVVAAAAADDVMLLTPSASSVDSIKGNDKAFRVCFSDPSQGTASAKYIKDFELATKVAVLYDSSNDYCQGLYDTFKTECAKLGIQILTVQTYTDTTNTDFSAQIAAIKESGAELVFLPIYYTPISLILTQASQMGYAPKWFGVDGMDGLLTVKGFDTSLAEGAMLLTPFVATAEDEATKSFVEKYQSADYGDGETPNQFAADAYDCIYALRDALEQAGVTADMDYSDICDALVETFTSEDFSFTGLTTAGEAATWSDTGEISKQPMGMVIQDGVYMPLDA